MAKRVTAREAQQACIKSTFRIEKLIKKGWWTVNSCPDCHGSGKFGKHVCYTCGGEADEFDPKVREMNAKIEMHNRR